MSKDNYISEDEYVSESERLGREKWLLITGDKIHTKFAKGKTSVYDGMATGITNPFKIYVLEVKNEDRPYTKHNTDGEDKGFLIDRKKCYELVKIAINENRIPIVACFFTDRWVFWNLLKTDWDKRAEWRFVNKSNYAYGAKKEWEEVTYLFLSEALRDIPPQPLS